jgi:hypothetical protein
LVGFPCFARGAAGALKIFRFIRFLDKTAGFFIVLNKLLAGTVRKYYNASQLPCLFPKPISMRTHILAGSLFAILFTSGAVAGVVVEKRSRQVPDTAVPDCEGVHSFVFRGPTGTSRRAILVPPREFWTAQEAGLYSFVLRYQSGNVCSRMVTPEVFARYQVGQDFYDREQPSERYQSDDSKTVQPVVQQEQRTAQLRHRRQKHASHRALAKHRRHHRSHRIAAR